MSSIFIAMPSMEDSELFKTIESIYNNADNPNEIYIGINFSYVEKNSLKEFKNFIKNYKNISYKTIKLSSIKRFNNNKIGTGISRTLASSLYSDQDYFLQTDSHLRMLKGWDTYIINLLKEAKEVSGNNKTVITAYPGPYLYEKDNIVVSTIPRTSLFLRNYMFFDVIPGWVDQIIENDKKFIPAIKTSGSFIFGDKEFAKNTGLEKEMFFLDEEIIQTINLISNGFSLVFTNISDFPISHMYNQDINEFGGSRRTGMSYTTLSNERSIINYLNYIENNKEKTDKYYRYSKVHPRLGSLKNGYIPENFNNVIE